MRRISCAWKMLQSSEICQTTDCRAPELGTLCHSPSWLVPEPRPLVCSSRLLSFSSLKGQGV